MGRVLLDTSVLIDALRGRPVAAERVLALRRNRDIALGCAVNVEEVVRGLRPSEVESAGRLLAGLRIVRLGRVEGMLAGRWRREYAQVGITLSQSDCLIAAAARSADAVLATGNPRHFPMPDVTVQHWQVGA